METKVHTYDGDEVKVTWDQKRCIHAKACVNGLPNVFDPERRPWIKPDEADADAVVEAVHQCPTGALHATRGGENPETPPDENRVGLFPNGPLLVRGDVEVLDSDGEVLLKDTRVALCRCGLSGNKPLCDGSHDGAFDDSGVIEADRLSDAEDANGVLRFQTTPNGPVLVNGSVTIEGEDGKTISGSKGALCRCGASGSKPFCDGSHNDAGFEAS